MIRLKIDRYYGNLNETKSYARLYCDDRLLLECEARELGYKDYEENKDNLYIAGFCMQRGVYEMSYSSAPNNRVCFRLKGVRHHRGLKVYCDEDVQRKLNTILLGYADQSVCMEHRRLKDVVACREAFAKILYQHYKEEAWIEVSNENVVYDEDPEREIDY